MKVVTDEKIIDEVLNRGVISGILPSKDEFKKVLMSGKKIKIYIGFDATADTLHLSHAKNIMLLEDFRKLGHDAILLFGDFTARIGDPSGQTGTRATLTRKQVLDNVKSWKKQIKNLGKFTGIKDTIKIKFNSKWLAPLTLEDVLNLASKTTVQQMIERDMFQKRIKEGKHIFLHEFMYPLMQGYDSVAMEVDAEMCGTDQTFNALMGRTLLRKIKNKEKFVVTVNLMENPKTGDLMSKSKGTGVFLNTKPKEMFGGIMAQPDEMIEVLLINCTRLSKDLIKEIINLGPLEAKKRTAFEILKIIFSEKEAEKAKESFVSTFQKKEIPDEMIEISNLENKTLMDLLVDNNVLASRGDFRRLIKEGAISNLDGDEKINDVNFIPRNDMKFKIGKKRFVKIN
ncbi:MAG: tyrosine--tRNA ligase [Burkholderiales bacterium]|nr:tyrosine--tRNA ligase [Burkholderiales bacterium]